MQRSMLAPSAHEATLRSNEGKQEIIVVDTGLTIKAGAPPAFERGDGAAFLTAEMATDKAWTAASDRYQTRARNDDVADPKVAPVQNLPRMMPVTGDYASVVGCIGVSGGDRQ